MHAPQPDNEAAASSAADVHQKILEMQKPIWSKYQARLVAREKGLAFLTPELILTPQPFIDVESICPYAFASNTCTPPNQTVGEVGSWGWGYLSRAKVYGHMDCPWKCAHTPLNYDFA